MKLKKTLYFNMKKINKFIKSEFCQNTSFVLGMIFFIMTFCVNTWLLIPAYTLFIISFYGVMNERVKPKETQVEEQKEEKAPSQWMGYKNGNKYTLVLFFDEKCEKYRIAEMYSLKIFNHQFDTKVDGLNYIYSNYENVVGLVVYNCY